MSHSAPFTLHCRITPIQRGKRFETIRELQRLARRLYEAFTDISGVTLAKPGGGQSAQIDTLQNSDYVDGMAVKPQFGESPAQAMVTGFYTVSTANSQPHPDKSVEFCGEIRTGAGGAQPYRVSTQPTAAVVLEVRTLKGLLDAAIATLSESTADITVFRLDYKGIVFGDRGYHFPR